MAIMFTVSMLLLRVPEIPRISKRGVSGQEWCDETTEGLTT